jgi:hypothetical protein
MAAVIIGGTVASAVPGVRPSPSGYPSPSFAPVPPTPSEVPPSVEPSPTLEPSVVPSVSPEPPETAPPGVHSKSGSGNGVQPESNGNASGEGSGAGAPDFSVCAGLTGLANAICRHQVLAHLHPGNPGLAKSLQHLEGNAAGHGSAKEPENPHGGSSH